MQNHTEELFAGSAPAVVTSERVLYTPSGFARTSLGYLQEIGTLKVHRPHTAGRKNLTSFLFFTVTEGCGELTYEGKTYVLKKGDCIFIDCREGIHPKHRQAAVESGLDPFLWTQYDSNI